MYTENCRRFFKSVVTINFCQIWIRAMRTHKVLFLSASRLLTSSRISSSGLPAIRALFKVLTSLAGQPTARPPKDIGLVHKPWLIRRYKVERERPLSCLTVGSLNIVLGMLEPLWALLNMPPRLEVFVICNRGIG